LTFAIKKKLLFQIAAMTFDAENYFLPKEKILGLITDYLQ